MSGSILGFILWAVFGCFVIGIGISAFFQKKAVGFWANVKPFPVSDVKGYNHAVGKLLIAYGIVFLVLGIPLLAGQNSPYILLSILGVMIETIVLMAVYQVSVTAKYLKK